MKKLNSNQKRSLIVVPILLVVLVCAGLATAQGNGQGKGFNKNGKGCGSDNFGFEPGHRIEMMAKRLDLSEEQRTSISEIFENGHKDGIEKRKELMRLRNEMKGEMLKDSPSEKTILSINSKMGALKTEMKASKLKSRLAVREELTAEQRDKMLVMGGPERRGGSGKKGARMGQSGARGCHKCDGPGNGPRNGGGGFHCGDNSNND